MKSEGRVYARGGVFWIAYYVNGKEFRESGGKTEFEAGRKLKGRLKEIYGDRFVGPKQERVTVSDLLDDLLAEQERNRAKDVRTSKVRVKPLRAFFGLYRAVDVTPTLVKRYVSERLADKKTRATVNREVSILRRAFNLAREEERLNRVPYFPMMKEENARQGFFEKAEFETVAAGLPEPVADAARFAYLSGWRRGEVLPLRWDAVDRAAKEVRLGTSKNGRPRSLPLDGALWELIERRWKAREFRSREGLAAVSPLVFHHKGKPLRDFRKSWAAACKSAKVPGRLFHDLRRTAVRNLIRAGVPQSVAMSITGHETDSVFRRYDIVSQEDKIQALRRTEVHLAGSEQESNVHTFPGSEHGQKADISGSNG
jgi:integrase